jgi:hypothetical protein
VRLPLPADVTLGPPAVEIDNAEEISKTMYFHRDDYLLLSRGGRVPRPAQVQVRHHWHTHPPSPGRLRRGGARLLAGLPRSATRSREASSAGQRSRSELDIHAYLELEFAVDDER